MATWTCGIAGCGRGFEGLERLIRHQAVDHADRECGVCGERVPAGYLAIRHAFEEHTRAEYLRAYDADADDIRVRERLLDHVEGRIDVPGLLEGIDADAGLATSAGD